MSHIQFYTSICLVIGIYLPCSVLICVESAFAVNWLCWLVDLRTHAQAELGYGFVIAQEDTIYVLNGNSFLNCVKVILKMVHYSITSEQEKQTDCDIDTDLI